MWYFDHSRLSIVIICHDLTQYRCFTVGCFYPTPYNAWKRKKILHASLSKDAHPLPQFSPWQFVPFRTVQVSDMDRRMAWGGRLGAFWWLKSGQIRCSDPYHLIIIISTSHHCHTFSSPQLISGWNHIAVWGAIYIHSQRLQIHNVIFIATFWLYSLLQRKSGIKTMVLKLPKDVSKCTLSLFFEAVNQLPFSLSKTHHRIYPSSLS